MNKFLLILALTIISVSVNANAKVPVVGDYVRIELAGDEYSGNITDITAGFICLNCSQNDPLMGKADYKHNDDYCIGIGQIQVLTYPKLIWAKVQRMIDSNNSTMRTHA